MDHIREFLKAVAVAALPLVGSPAHAADVELSGQVRGNILTILNSCEASGHVPVTCGTFTKEGTPSFAHVPDRELAQDLTDAPQFSVMLSSYVSSLTNETTNVFTLNFQNKDGTPWHDHTGQARNQALTFKDGQFWIEGREGASLNLLDVFAGITKFKPPSATVDEHSADVERVVSESSRPRPRPENAPAEDPFAIHELGSNFNCLSQGQQEIINLYELVDESKKGGGRPEIGGLYRYEGGGYKMLLMTPEGDVTDEYNVELSEEQFSVVLESGSYSLPEVLANNGWQEIDEMRLTYDTDNDCAKHGFDGGPGLLGD